MQRLSFLIALSFASASCGLIVGFDDLTPPDAGRPKGHDAVVPTDSHQSDGRRADARTVDAGGDTTQRTDGPARDAPTMREDSHVCTMCGTSCVDLETNAENCGACGNVCNPNGLAPLCSGGSCSLVTIASSAGSPQAIALDDASVYWGSPENGGVERASLDGGAAVTLGTFSMGVVSQMALDSTSLYGANVGAVRGIWMLAKNPDAGERIITPPPGAFFGVAVDDSHVYWNEGAQLFRQPKPLVPDAGTGSAIATFAGDASASDPGPLLLNGSTLYWSDTGLGVIAMVSTAGGSPTTLVSGVGAKGLSVEGPWLYFLDGAGGRVGKLPLDGGPVVTVVQDAGMGTDRAVTDGVHVYWSTQDSIWYAPLDGGATALLIASTGGNDINGLAINSRYLYWTDGATNTVMRAKLPP